MTTFTLPPGTTARYGNFTVIAETEADYERIAAPLREQDTFSAREFRWHDSETGDLCRAAIWHDPGDVTWTVLAPSSRDRVAA